jgi:flavin-dependent dehydrogenase
MHTPYDVIVAGARVAGSPTAMLLARKGYKILLVDRTTFRNRDGCVPRGA